MLKRILVVDDDPQIQNLICAFLTKAGYAVNVCADGFAAVDELHASHYDLIILDINMPVLNGFKALSRIRANNSTKHIPVLMLTGSQNVGDVLRAKNFAVSDYILKPPTRDDIVSRVDRILNERLQFDEYEFSPDDPLSSGSFSVNFTLKSINNEEIVLLGDQPLKKGTIIPIIDLGLFSVLKIEKSEFIMTECRESEPGKYQYHISFQGLSKASQEHIKNWINSEHKNSAGKKVS